MGGNPISAGELRRIARLAGLDLDGAELESLRRDVSQVLELADSLADGGQPERRRGRTPTVEAAGGRGRLGAEGLPPRADECHEPDVADELLTNAPLVRERHIVVPRVIE